MVWSFGACQGEVKVTLFSRPAAAVPRTENEPFKHDCCVAWARCFASHLVLQRLRDGMVPGVVEVNLTPLYGHRTTSSYLGGKLHGVVHQQLPAQVHNSNSSSFPPAE